MPTVEDFKVNVSADFKGDISKGAKDASVSVERLSKNLDRNAKRSVEAVRASAGLVEVFPKITSDSSRTTTALGSFSQAVQTASAGQRELVAAINESASTVPQLANDTDRAGKTIAKLSQTTIKAVKSEKSLGKESKKLRSELNLLAKSAGKAQAAMQRVSDARTDIEDFTYDASGKISDLSTKMRVAIPEVTLLLRSSFRRWGAQFGQFLGIGPVVVKSLFSIAARAGALFFRRFARGVLLGKKGLKGFQKTAAETAVTLTNAELAVLALKKGMLLLGGVFAAFTIAAGVAMVKFVRDARKAEKSFDKIGKQVKSTKGEIETFRKTTQLLSEVTGEKRGDIAAITQKFIEIGQSQVQAAESTAAALRVAKKDKVELQTVVEAIASGYQGSADGLRKLGLVSLDVTEKELVRNKVVDKINKDYEGALGSIGKSALAISKLKITQEGLVRAAARVAKAYDWRGIWETSKAFLVDLLRFTVFVFKGITHTVAYLLERLQDLTSFVDDWFSADGLTLWDTFELRAGHFFDVLWDLIKLNSFRWQREVRKFFRRDIAEMNREIEKITRKIDNSKEAFRQKYIDKLKEKEDSTNQGFLRRFAELLKGLSKDLQPGSPESTYEDKAEKTAKAIKIGLKDYTESILDIADEMRKQREKIEGLNLKDELGLTGRKNQLLFDSIDEATRFLEDQKGLFGKGAGVEGTELASTIEEHFGPNSPLLKYENQISAQLPDDPITADVFRTGIKSVYEQTSKDLSKLRMSQEATEKRFEQARQKNLQAQIDSVKKVEEASKEAAKNKDKDLITQLEKDHRLEMRRLKQVNDSIVESGDKSRDTFEERRSKIIESGSKAISELQDALSDENERLLTKTEDVVTAIKDAEKTSKEQISELIEANQKYISATLGAINSIASGSRSITTAEEARSPVISKFNEETNRFRDEALSIREEAASAETIEDRKKAQEEFRKLLESRRDEEKAFTQDLKDSVIQADEKNALIGDQAAKSAAVTFGTLAADAWLPGAGQVVGPLVELLDQSPEKIRIMTEKFAEGFSNLVVKLSGNLPTIIAALVNGLIDAIPDIVGALVEAVPTFIGALIQGVGQIVDNIKESVAEMGRALWSDLKSFLATIGNYISKIFVGLKNVVTGAFKTLWKGIVGIKDAIVAFFKDGAKAFFDQIKGLFGFGSGGKDSDRPLPAKEIDRRKKESRELGDNLYVGLATLITGVTLGPVGAWIANRKLRQGISERPKSVRGVIGEEDEDSLKDISNQFGDFLKNLPAIIPEEEENEKENKDFERRFAHTAANAFNPFLDALDQDKTPVQLLIQIGDRKLSEILVDLQEGGYQEVFAV